MADPEMAARWEGARDDRGPSEGLALDLVTLATLAAAAAGVGSLAGGNLAWDGDAAVNGVVGQLATTLPAALLVLVATAANLAAGAVLARATFRAPIRGTASLLLSGMVGAVLLDTALLFLLGGTGLFRAPMLIAVHLAILALGWRLQLIVVPGSIRLAARGPLWAIVAVAWAGAIAVQLASPVVPFLDVLPNHVAPVERLRTLGDFAVLTESPAPIYGPSRTFLGYVALLGTITTITGLPAGLAVSAFILPSSVLVAAGVHRLAAVLGGPGAGVWGLVAFILTASFGRLTDARATVVVLPLALAALVRVAEELQRDELADADGATGDDPDAAAGPSHRGRDAATLGAALGAAVLVHPVVGALAVVTAGFVALLRPGFGPVGIAAVAVAAAISLPQAATMLGFAIPSIAGLAVVIPAVLAARFLATDTVGFVGVTIGRAVVVGLIPVGLALAEPIVTGTVAGTTELVTTMPLLVIGAVAGFVLAPRSAGHPVIVAGLAAGVAVAALTQAMPQGTGLLTDAIRFELPKTLHYWLPVFAALATAFGLHALWRRADLPVATRAAVVGIALVVAVLPLRSEEIDDHHLGEHRLAETLAVDLRFAGRGYWATYPDARRVVDPPRQALLDAIRAEIDAGRIDGRTDLLHVAGSFQQWVATPIGVFTGVRETLVSPDAEESIHTTGGRLRRPDQLGDLLASGAFEFSVLEPGDAPAGAREAIVAAGYRRLFGNEQGELFRRP